MKKKSLMVLVAVGSLAVSAVAQAHITAANTVAIANASTVVELQVAHGCDGVDTNSLTVDIPAGVTAVRPMWDSSYRTSFTVDAMDAKLLTTVTWTKPLDAELPADSNFAKVGMRLKIPNKPFTTLYYKIHQTCKAVGGVLSYAEWTATPSDPVGEAAAQQVVLPARLPGWNKFTAPDDIADITPYVKDARIVWNGTEAFSINPNTVALIGTTAGVTLLPVDGVKAADEIWVLY